MSGLYTRAFPLEDIRIRSGGGGRVVEAYAAVFGTPAHVRDQDGEYDEEIDHSAFNKAIRDAAPAGSRANWGAQVLYNHGMTLHGTPSELASVPIGVPMDIKADRRGLLTVTRYLNGDFPDLVLENIRAGSITGYSFTGRFLRSNPTVPRAGFRRRASGFVTVRRLESTLKEYGPTPFPIYADAAVVAMRAMLANGLGLGDDSGRATMAAAEINDLPDDAFAYIEPGGGKDDDGKTIPRSLRHFPIHDAAHVRNALARAPQSPFGEKAMPKIRKAAEKYGIDVADSQHRAAPAGPPRASGTPDPGAVTEEPHAEGAHSARSAIGWANTRRLIRERTGVRNAEKEEVRSPSRAT